MAITAGQSVIRETARDARAMGVLAINTQGGIVMSTRVLTMSLMGVLATVGLLPVGSSAQAASFGHYHAGLPAGLSRPAPIAGLYRPGPPAGLYRPGPPAGLFPPGPPAGLFRR